MRWMRVAFDSDAVVSERLVPVEHGTSVRLVCPVRLAAVRFAYNVVHWALCLWLGMAASAAEGTDGPSTATLIWKNDDRMTGVLLSGDESTICWQSTLFSEPFTLRTDQLIAVRYQETQPLAAERQPLRFVTTDNDLLFGDLAEITPEHVVITSPRHGVVRIGRTMLLGFQQTDPSAAGTVGLGALTDWRTLHRGRAVSEWSREATGYLTTSVTAAELYRDLRMTGLSEIELELAWAGKPGFVISFAAPTDLKLPDDVVKLETWNNDLVIQTLATNGEFEVIRTLPNTVESIALRLQWNPTTGDLKVYSDAGQLLGKSQGDPQRRVPLSGLYIENKESTLTLKRLRATGWQETADNEQAGGRARLRLRDDTTVTGEIERYEAPSRTLFVTSSQGAAAGYALDQISSLELGHEAFDGVFPAASRVSFADGTQVRGTILSIDREALQMRVPYCSELLPVRLQGASEIQFEGGGSVADVSASDLLVVNDQRLHGEVCSIADANQAMGWRPVGSSNASSLPADRPIQIVRGEGTEVPVERAASEFVDRLFLRTGDSVPCRIHQIDASSIHADFPLTESSRIERTLLTAAEFGAFAAPVLRGLDDPRWTLKEHGRNAARREEDRIVVSGTTMIGCTALREASEVRFDIEWEPAATAVIQIHLFAESAERITGQPALMIYRTGGTQVVMQAMGGGGMRNVEAEGVQETGTARNSLRIKLSRKKVVISDGDRELFDIPRAPQSKEGKCLAIYVSPLNVNNGGMGVIGGAPARADKPSTLMTFSNLQLRSGNADLLNLLLDEENKQRLLTVPRFRKQSPPTEILVGSNGDLLRGRLIDLDPQRARFQSRLEELEISRERLTGIIWPQPVEPSDAADQDDPQLARLVFRDGTVMRMMIDQLRGTDLAGRHPALGTIAVPLSLVREIWRGYGAAQSAANPFSSWTLRPAEEPHLVSGQDGSASGGSTGNVGAGSPLVGQPAPGFTADLLDGTRLRVPDPNRRVVVLDFWASWCGPCVKAMPQTMHTVAEYPPDRVLLLAVNQLETPETIRAFLAARGWDVPVALDSTGEIGKQYLADAIPQLVVIDTEGTVRAVWVGDRPEVQEQLKSLLVELTQSTTPQSPEAAPLDH